MDAQPEESMANAVTSRRRRWLVPTSCVLYCLLNIKIAGSDGETVVLAGESLRESKANSLVTSSRGIDSQSLKI
jgi:hypothetical protein